MKLFHCEKSENTAKQVAGVACTKSEARATNAIAKAQPLREATSTRDSSANPSPIGVRVTKRGGTASRRT